MTYQICSELEKLYYINNGKSREESSEYIVAINCVFKVYGGHDWIRTSDHFHVKEALYH